MANQELTPLRGDPDFGAWRLKNPNETTAPEYTIVINGEEHVPVRIYGPKPKDQAPSINKNPLFST